MFFSKELTALPNFKSAAIFMFSNTVKSSWSRSSCVMYDVDFLNSSVTVKFHDRNGLVLRRIDCDRILTIGMENYDVYSLKSLILPFTYTAPLTPFSTNPERALSSVDFPAKLIHVKTCQNNSGWILNTCLRLTDPWSRSNYRSEKSRWPCGEFLFWLQNKHVLCVNMC